MIPSPAGVTHGNNLYHCRSSNTTEKRMKIKIRKLNGEQITLHNVLGFNYIVNDDGNMVCALVYGEDAEYYRNIKSIEIV